MVKDGKLQNVLVRVKGTVAGAPAAAPSSPPVGRGSAEVLVHPARAGGRGGPAHPGAEQRPDDCTTCAPWRAPSPSSTWRSRRRSAGVQARARRRGDRPAQVRCAPVDEGLRRRQPAPVLLHHGRGWLLLHHRPAGGHVHASRRGTRASARRRPEVTVKDGETAEASLRVHRGLAPTRVSSGTLTLTPCLSRPERAGDWPGSAGCTCAGSGSSSVSPSPRSCPRSRG